MSDTADNAATAAENTGGGAASGTSSIRRSSSGSRSKKKKKNQLPFGFLSFIVLIAVGILLLTFSQRLGLFWFLGLAFGFILQKARFCFTASLRDPYLTGGTNLTKAVLIAFAITSIGFTAIKYGAASRGLPIPGMGYVVPVSGATAVGAFMFGIGMVISGGCASGTLMRVGEGFTMQILSLVFFIAGSLWGAHDFGFWKYNVILRGKAVFLPNVFGWMGAIAIQLVFIAFLFIMADRWANRKQQES
jgi:uncharacterized protein